MKKVSRFLLPLIPAIIIFVLVLLGPFAGLDSMLCDLVYKQMHGTGDTIKLICIDEETLAEYGNYNEWCRIKSTELINYLYDGSDNEPSVLAFDIMFTNETDEDRDSNLAAAASGKNIISATNLVYRGLTKYQPGGVPYFDAYNIDMEERPFALLDKEISSGFANVALSRDGFVRTARMYVDIDGARRYNFAAITYLKYMEGLGRYDEALDRVEKDDNIQFFYSGIPGEFTHFSMADVLGGRIPKEVFKDSIVMVGAYAPGFQDAYHSSARRGIDMYGVEVNANIVNALITGKTAIPVSAILVAIISSIIVYGYTLMARTMKMYPAIIVGIWFVIGELVLGRILAVNGRLIGLVYFIIVIILVIAWIIIEKYLLELFNKKKVINTFKKYMAPQVIDAMAKDDEFHIELGGEKRDVAVLFVDIRGFTTLSESLTPEEIVQILNQYLSLTTSCIFEHGGMLDKFIGDATMAIFNAPNDQEDYVYKAILAGLDMQKKGKALGDKLCKEYGKRVSFGVGIHAGDAVVGNIGSENRMDYTAIGDTVNTASRIEGKSLAGELLISEKVYDLLKDRIDASYKDEVMLKGKAEPVKIYNVTGLKEKVNG